MNETEAVEVERAGESSMLQRLEQLVGKATDEIVRLRQAKQELDSKVAALEKERDEGQGVLSQWTEQQDEVEARLESLAAGLEGLLTE